ncbi:MAG: hypothetical protein LZF63_06175 [Nitrosomonas sp.]|nr:hypothetical protein [Nitrosomonas sp.]MCG7756229.1 hypothetical protein [Nitrosomonas sp.]UJP08376.1 MAG: hypothetical protein LZF84_04550 [Nitrosomonas sp.]
MYIPPIIAFLAALILGSIYMSGSSAFAQSTPPLDSPIEKPVDMSESGRIQEESDRRREKADSPDSDEKHQDTSVTPPYSTRPIIENPDNSIGPNSKHRYP